MLSMYFYNWYFDNYIFSVTKVTKIVIEKPIVFLLVLVALFTYYIIQTSLSFPVIKWPKLKYEECIILINPTDVICDKKVNQIS